MVASTPGNEMKLREGDTIFTLAPKRWAAEHGLFPLDLLKDTVPKQSFASNKKDTPHVKQDSFAVNRTEKVVPSRQQPPLPPIQTEQQQSRSKSRYTAPPDFDADPRTVSPIDGEENRKSPSKQYDVVSQEKLTEMVSADRSSKQSSNVSQASQVSPSPRRTFNNNRTSSVRVSEDVKDDGAAEGFHMDM